MKEPYGEGAASHTGPESCVVARNRESFTLYEPDDDPIQETQYTANDLNQYDATTDPSDSYTYDDDGVFEYTWDMENRLTLDAPNRPRRDGVAFGPPSTDAACEGPTAITPKRRSKLDAAAVCLDRVSMRPRRTIGDGIHVPDAQTTRYVPVSTPATRNDI